MCHTDGLLFVVAAALLDDAPAGITPLGRVPPGSRMRRTALSPSPVLGSCGTLADLMRSDPVQLPVTPTSDQFDGLNDLLDDVSNEVGDIGIGLDLVDDYGVRMGGGIPPAEGGVHNVVDILGDDAGVAADLQNL